MTSATVNDVRALAAAKPSGKGMKVGGAGSTGSAGNARAGDFRAVWNKQAFGKTVMDIGINVSKTPSDITAQNSTEKLSAMNGEESTAKDNALTTQGENIVSDENTFTTENNVISEDSVTSESKPSTENSETDSETALVEGMTQEELKAAMEVLTGLFAEFAKQIAQVLGISEGEMQSILKELGMTQSDLLVPDKLMQFVLAAGGEGEMVSLVTDEGLYQNFQNLMGQLQETITRFNEQTGLTPEQLASIPKNEEGLLLPSMEEANMELGTPVMIVREENEKDPSQNSMENGKEESTYTQNQVESMTDTKNSSAGNEQKESSSDQGQKESVFSTNLLENLKSQIVQTQVQQAVAADSTDTEAIMKQIMDYMKLQMKPDVTNLELQLKPESLGTLHVHLTARQGIITAQFIAESHAVKNALESQMMRLADSFQQQGIKVEAVEVTVQTHEFERNRDQGGFKQQEEDGKRNRSKNREINLNIPINLEEMSEEERLAADIMAANGNTVDYTA